MIPNLFHLVTWTNWKKEVNKKDQFFYFKNIFPVVCPSKTTYFLCFPPKKNKTSKTHRGGFSLSRLCGGKLRIPKNPLGQFVLLGSFLHPFCGGAKFSAGSLWSQNKQTFLEWFVEPSANPTNVVLAFKIIAPHGWRNGAFHETVDAVMGGKPPRVWLGYNESIRNEFSNVLLSDVDDEPTILRRYHVFKWCVMYWNTLCLKERSNLWI